MFSDDFRAERARLGLSQQALSKTLGVPKRTIENCEGGVNSPPSWAEKLIMERMEKMAMDKILKSWRTLDPKTFDVSIGDKVYRRDGTKVYVEHEGRVYHGSTGAAYQHDGATVAIKCFASPEDAGQPICYVHYDVRGQRDALGVYHDRGAGEVLAGCPSAFEFWMRGERVVL